MFSGVPGYFRETDQDQVMEKVDAAGLSSDFRSGMCVRFETKRPSKCVVFNRIYEEIAIPLTERMGSPEVIVRCVREVWGMAIKP